MKKVSLIAGLMLLVAGMAWAQSDSHTVTVTVSAINVIDVDNDVTLTINAAAPGENPTPVSNNTANLLWTTNGSGKKILVRANSIPSGITLTVQAQNVTKNRGSGDGSGGPASAGTVELTTSDQDFITGAGKSAGQCDLNYTASATVDADITSNNITVTYTITNS